MKTPTGKECPYFYGDYYRGKHHEECRLLETEPSGAKWSPDLCSSCPVPSIKLANACPNIILTPEVKKPFLIGRRQVKVTAFCTKSQQLVKEPKIGCGICHPLAEIFGEIKK